MNGLTPKEIVAELDRYVIGQEEAKRAVAIALRNRWRRQQLGDDLRGEVQPKNILMIGPTGVGKTEIARRVSRVVNAPFIKVEATKFTEVGYVGRDVESMIRELLESSISQLHGERMDAVRAQARGAAVQRLVDLLVEQAEQRGTQNGGIVDTAAAGQPIVTTADKRRLTRKRKQLVNLLSQDSIDALAGETVEIDIETDSELFSSPVEIVSGVSPEELHDAFRGMLDSFAPRREQRRVSVQEARHILTHQEAQRLIDIDSIVETAIRRVEEAGVVFIDELDKTIHGGGDFGPDISGEGVQRDLLPIIEGCVVLTRHGPVRTDHILFIAAGSFTSARPSDLIPELQGRFPLRVELHSLDEDDLFAILTEPENALTRQSVALLATEGVTLDFHEDGLREIAALAAEVNSRTEDIGARRLHTIVERVLEGVSFDAPEQSGSTVVVDAAYVTERIGDIVSDDDLNNAIL
ncbi:MAG TPA: ATP-dependent protease ATPase subunit HslU [Thermomicrobiales bacterium]|nr:ATP-dependent protease ATPase subunit HslU [Thermomicrobiales bacterium]